MVEKERVEVNTINNNNNKERKKEERKRRGKDEMR